MSFEKFLKKNWLFVLIVLVLGFFYGESQGWFEIPSPFAMITLSDIQAGCKFGQPNYATVTCQQGGEISKMFVLKPSLFTSVSNTMKIELENSAISSVSGAGCGYLLEVFDTSTNTKICSYTSSSDTCGGKPLIYGKSYTLKASGGCILGETSLTTVIKGYPLWLYYSSPFTGTAGYGWQIPESENCFAQDWISNLNKLGANAQSETGSLDSSNISQRSVNLVKGQSIAYRLLYSDVSPIYSTYKNEFGQDIPIQCDQYNRLLKGFSKVEALSGQCYAIPDSSIVVKQGYDPSKPNYVDKFCCSSDMCRAYGLSSDYVCANYKCVLSTSPEAQQPQQCKVADDCSPFISTNFITDESGKNYQMLPSCVSGQCQEQRIEIACNPKTSYANNLCCVKSEGVYKLQDCIGSVRDCAATLGSDACCLANNTLGYTVHATPPSPDLKCCVDETGIGKFKTSCEEKIEWNLFAGLGAWFKSFLEGLGIKLPDIDIASLGLVFLFIIIIVALIYMRKGKQGYGGGTTVVIAR